MAFKSYFTTAIIVVCFVMSSCSYKTYPVSTLDFNYDMNMTTKAELFTKSNVHIFLSPEEVGNDFEYLAFVKYSPFIKIPILLPERAQQLKKFYKKAVIKTEELGGNGVIVETVGSFRVIDIPSLKNADTIQLSVYNPIMNRNVLDKFVSGEVNNYDERQQTQYVTRFKDEITSNIKAAKTLEDTDFISTKISALRSFYKAVNDKLDESKLDKYMAEFELPLKAAIKKIEAKNSKVGKKAASAIEKVKDSAEQTKQEITL